MSSYPPRRSQQALFYASDFAVQSALGTPLNSADIDKQFPRDDSGNIIVAINKQPFPIRHCTGEYLQKLLYLARSSRITAPFYADIDLLFGLLGWAGGVIAGNQVTLLPAFEYDLPLTSLIFSNRNDGIDPLLFQDMAVDFVEITHRSGNRISGNVQWKGSGKITPLPGYVEPGCSTPNPLFMKDGAFTLDGVDRAQDLRAFTCRIGNNAATETEDSFPYNDPDIFRNQRGEERDYSLNITLAGAEHDATWDAANSIEEGDNEIPFSLRMGSADEGITIAPVGNAIIEQTGDPGFDGQVARKTFPYRLTPLPVEGQPSPIVITRETAGSS